MHHYMHAPRVDSLCVWAYITLSASILTTTGLLEGAGRLVIQSMQPTALSHLSCSKTLARRARSAPLLANMLDAWLPHLQMRQS